MRRVLAVDDDPDILVTLEALLSTVPDLEFRGVETEEAARDTIASWTPDIALVDLRLGPSSGAELLRFVAEEAPAILRVLLTAYDSDALEKLGVRQTDAHYTIEKNALVSSVQVLEEIIGAPLARRTPSTPVSPPLLPDWLLGVTGGAFSAESSLLPDWIFGAT